MIALAANQLLNLMRFQKRLPQGVSGRYQTKIPMTTRIELLQMLLTCPQPLELILNQLNHYPWDSDPLIRLEPYRFPLKNKGDRFASFVSHLCHNLAIATGSDRVDLNS
jgi:hypothetical protein